MAESKDEILAELKLFREAVDNRLDGIDAKLGDLKADIHVIHGMCSKLLAPAEIKKPISGSGQNWVPEVVAAKNR